MITQSYNFHQYRPIQQMKVDLQKLKKKLVKEIMRKVKPHMWESGFVTGEIGKSRNIHLFVFPKDKYYKLNASLGNIEFSGFTDTECIITDAWMAMVNMPMIYMHIEDLFKLHYWVMNDRYNHFKVTTPTTK